MVALILTKLNQLNWSTYSLGLAVWTLSHLRSCWLSECTSSPSASNFLGGPMGVGSGTDRAPLGHFCFETKTTEGAWWIHSLAFVNFYHFLMLSTELKMSLFPLIFYNIYNVMYAVCCMSTGSWLSYVMKNHFCPPTLPAELH